MPQDADLQQQQQLVELHRQQAANMDGQAQQQGPLMEPKDETGSDGESLADLCSRVVRTPNANSPIRERSIPPLTYRENPGLVYLDNQDVEVSHEVR